MFVVISWPPPLISQLFSPRLFRAVPVFTAWLVLHRYILHGKKWFLHSLSHFASKNLRSSIITTLNWLQVTRLYYLLVLVQSQMPCYSDCVYLLGLSLKLIWLLLNCLLDNIIRSLLVGFWFLCPDPFRYVIR